MATLLITHDYVINSVRQPLCVSTEFGTTTHIQRMVMIFVRYAKKWSKKHGINYYPMKRKYVRFTLILIKILMICLFH